MSTITPTPTPTEPPALALRCRDAEWIDRAATLDEFAAVAPLADPHANLAELLIRGMLGPSQRELRELLAGARVVGCERPCFPIPVGVHELDAPALEDWHLREQLEVEVFAAGPDGRLRHSAAVQFRRGLLAIAGALPLLASPRLAHAHAPLRPAATLAPRALLGVSPPATTDEAAPPSPPDAETSEPATTPPAPQVAAPDELPPPQASASPPSPPSTSPATATTSPFDRGLVRNDRWLHLLDKQIRLKMRTGPAFEGRLIAQSNTEIAVVRSVDGVVVSAPKQDIALVEEVAQDEKKQLNVIHNRYVLGAPMLAVGSGMVLATIIPIAIAPTPSQAYLALVGVPGVALVVGGALLVASAHKKRKALEDTWTKGGIPVTARVRMTPTLAAGRNGGQAGLVLRF